MLKTPLLFTPVFLQTDYFHFQQSASCSHASTNIVVPKTEWGWVMDNSPAQWGPLPLPEVDPPFSHHSSSRSGLQRRLDWLAPTWKGSDLSSQVPKVTMEQMLSLSPLLRAGPWLRRETGCPTFLDDPDPGQPEGKHAHCQSLCSIALKWEYLALVNLHTAYYNGALLGSSSWYCRSWRE